MDYVGVCIRLGFKGFWQFLFVPGTVCSHTISLSCSWQRIKKIPLSFCSKSYQKYFSGTIICNDFYVGVG